MPQPTRNPYTLRKANPVILCNGSHVILHRHRHGDAVYACTLENAKKLLENCLATDASQLVQLSEGLMRETRPVRSARWLNAALGEVYRLSEEPTGLQLVLHGRAPKGGPAMPMPVVTQAMQDTLVLACFHHGIKLESLGVRGGMQAEEDTTHLWRTLEFLAPARARIGSDVVFVDDVMYDSYVELKELKTARWKETAKEQNIVANHYCPFLNEWTSGNWSVEEVLTP